MNFRKHVRDLMPSITTNPESHKYEAIITVEAYGWTIQADRKAWYLTYDTRLIKVVSRDASPLANFQAAAMYLESMP